MVFSIKYYVIAFVSDLQQVDGVFDSAMGDNVCRWLISGWWCSRFSDGGKERTFTTQYTISIFPLWTFHLYVATFQQHLLMEYISWLVWYCSPCCSYYDFRDSGLLLTRILLSQGSLLTLISNVVHLSCIKSERKYVLPINPLTIHAKHGSMNHHFFRSRYRFKMKKWGFL